MSNEKDDHEEGKKMTVKVNEQKVELPSDRVTGMQIKEAAKNQGVQIELDFQLFLEGRDGNPTRSIGDNQTIEIDKKDEFLCNTGDHDS
jgi:hypothetical protein